MRGRSWWGRGLVPWSPCASPGFVTSLAWTFIVLAGLGTVIAVPFACFAKRLMSTEIKREFHAR